MKQINDLTIKEVGSISSPTEVSVKMPLMLTNGTKANISIPVSTYYVAFSAQDEYDKWLCVVTCADFSYISTIKKMLDGYVESGNTFALLKGNMEDGVFHVSSLISERYNVK